MRMEVALTTRQRNAPRVLEGAENVVAVVKALGSLGEVMDGRVLATVISGVILQ